MCQLCKAKLLGLILRSEKGFHWFCKYELSTCDGLGDCARPDDSVVNKSRYSLCSHGAHSWVARNALLFVTKEHIITNWNKCTDGKEDGRIREVEKWPFSWVEKFENSWTCPVMWELSGEWGKNTLEKLNLGEHWGGWCTENQEEKEQDEVWQQVGWRHARPVLAELKILTHLKGSKQGWGEQFSMWKNFLWRQCKGLN